MTTALITGGTSGIGAAFARALARRGHDLVLVARDTARLAETAASLREAYGVEVETLPADLSVRADVDRVAERLSSTERPVEMLVNNAGFGVRTPLTADDLSIYDVALEVMVRAVLVLGGAAGRTMRARGSGRIVNVSSTAGLVTMGGYSAIKAWVTSYSEGLATELAGTGVTVTALLPGWVRTEFHGRASIRSGGIPDALWLEADPLVEECLRDVDRGRVVSIPTRRYASLSFLLRHAPRPLVRTVSGKLRSPRH